MTNNFSNNDLYLKSTGPVVSNNPSGGVGYGTGAGNAITQSSFTLSGTAVADTAGNCTCTAPATNLTVGMAIAVTGTLTGTETGIATSTTYYIIATNGSTTFQLSASRGGAAITTTAGTTTGLTFTINGSSTRTTGLYINTVSGSITLVSAAGSATAASFTVNNSSVGANDTISVSQKSGTDKYIIAVTAVAAGSFVITSYTTGGTTTEQPVFNFNVIKGTAA